MGTERILFSGRNGRTSGVEIDKEDSGGFVGSGRERPVVGTGPVREGEVRKGFYTVD